MRAVACCEHILFVSPRREFSTSSRSRLRLVIFLVVLARSRLLDTLFADCPIQLGADYRPQQPQHFDSRFSRPQCEGSALAIQSTKHVAVTRCVLHQIPEEHDMLWRWQSDNHQLIQARTRCTQAGLHWAVPRPLLRAAALPGPCECSSPSQRELTGATRIMADTRGGKHGAKIAWLLLWMEEQGPRCAVTYRRTHDLAAAYLARPGAQTSLVQEHNPAQHSACLCRLLRSQQTEKHMASATAGPTSAIPSHEWPADYIL